MQKIEQEVKFPFLATRDLPVFPPINESLNIFKHLNSIHKAWVSLISLLQAFS